MEIDEDKIELRNEEFQEVLESVPPWILRWGITTLAIIVSILIAGSAIFKYPDIITSTVSLTGSTPPAAIVAKSSGKIVELHVDDNQNVYNEDYLAVIENPSVTADVLILKEYLESINLDEDTLMVLPPKNLKLGNIQSTYSDFYITLFEYVEYKRIKYLSRKVEILKERIDQYKGQYENIERQKKIIEMQLSISKEKLERDSLLNRKGVLSNEEIENTRTQFLQDLLSYENICSSIENMQIQISQTEESLFDTNYQVIETNNSFQSKLRTLSTQLETDIQTWELNYVIKAPITGKITFTNYWTINQNVNLGEIVFNIIPEAEVEVLGKASLPIARSGKVKVGQKVNIRFDNFPDQEYGVVKGIVKNISLVPIKENQNSVYTVEVELPDGLITTYKKELPYLPDMQGNADIITEDITLLERFILPIKKVLNEGLQ